VAISKLWDMEAWAKPEAKPTCVGVDSERQGMGAGREAAVGENGTMGGAQPERLGVPAPAHWSEHGAQAEHAV